MCCSFTAAEIPYVARWQNKAREYRDREAQPHSLWKSALFFLHKTISAEKVCTISGNNRPSEKIDGE